MKKAHFMHLVVSLAASAAIDAGELSRCPFAVLPSNNRNPSPLPAKNEAKCAEILQEISGRPRRLRGDLAVMACAKAKRLLAAETRNREGRAKLGMPLIRVLEIATFYTMFNLAPVGRFHIQMCGTTPCLLAGSDAIKEILRKRIGEQGQVTRTACSPGSKSNVWAPAAMRRWSRSMRIITRI